MAPRRRNPGLTLVEMLLTIAIVAILVTVMAVSASSLRTQANIKLTQSAMSVISAALQQYYDFYGKYPPEQGTDTPLQSLAKAVNHDPTDVKFMVINKATMPPVASPTWATMNPVPLGAVPDSANAASYALYLYLFGVPASRSILSKLSEQMTASDETDTKGNPFVVYWTKPAIDRRMLTRFIDAWGKPLRYEYKTGDMSPVVVSSGPDKNFGTPDDIRSNGK
jgi:prepilin-type N-terminal cleavage/methylation domain-containing protein